MKLEELTIKISEKDYQVLLFLLKKEMVEYKDCDVYFEWLSRAKENLQRYVK